MSDGWDDLFETPPDPPMNLTMAADDWIAAARQVVGDASVSADEMASALVQTLAPEEQPETGASASQVSSDGSGLFGADEQFHVAWQHWKGMPEFHMDDLSPDSTLVVKFRTPEAREEFASLLRNVGIEIRKEEPRGIWYPKIEIAHFWDKRYRDAAVETTDNTPIMSEADEVDDSETQDEGAA